MSQLGHKRKSNGPLPNSASPLKADIRRPAGPVCTKAEFGLTRHATARSNDLLRTARLGVIATDHPFDLTSWTASIVNEDDLALTHCTYRRLLLQGCGKYRTGGAHQDKGRNDDCRPDHSFYPSSYCFSHPIRSQNEVGQSQQDNVGFTSRNFYLMTFRFDRQFMNFSKNRPEAIIRSHQKAKRRDRMRISPIKYSFQSA
jgi:hypothetical protein